MNEFESGISLSQSPNGVRVFLSEYREENMVSESKMAAIIKVESEWMSEGFFVQMVNQSWQVWVSLKGKTKWLNPRWQIFRMTAIIKLSQNEWVSQIELVWVRVRMERVFLSESQKKTRCLNGRIQDGCHHQVESEWMSEVFFCANGGNQSWQVWVSLKREN